MKNTFKKFVSLLLLVMMAVPVILIGAVPAKAQGNLLVDNADLLSDYEESEVLSALQGVSDQYGIDVAVLTVNSMNGKDAMTYTDDYYDEHGYAENGVLLMVCMGEREYWISTSGTLINALSDMGIDFIGNNVAQSLSNGSYAAAFTDYADMVESFVSEYESTGEAYDTDNLPDEEDYDFNYTGDYADLYEGRLGGFSLTKLLISLVVGCFISFVIMRTFVGQVKNVHSRNNAGDYLDRNSLSIYTRNDRFLYRNINRVPIPKAQDNNHGHRSHGGGGSSVHRSSGGHSHGGGGGHF